MSKHSKKAKKAASRPKEEPKVEKTEAIELKNEHLTRQLDIIPVEVLGEQINIIGAGAIGSFTALALAKMGFENIKVWDDDTIEIENMNCQFYRHSDIGKPKAEALKDLIKSFTGVEIETVVGRYEKGVLPGIVITAVDSMKARRLVWDNHKEQALATRFIIDPRMGAEQALLYTMNPMDQDDIEAYEACLYNDAEAVQERCTAKATMYTACMLSGLVAKAVKDIVTDSKYPRSAQWAIKENAFMAWGKEDPLAAEKAAPKEEKTDEPAA